MKDKIFTPIQLQVFPCTERNLLVTSISSKLSKLNVNRLEITMQEVDKGMTIQKELKRRFLEVADTLVHQVCKRHSRLSELDSRFGLLCRPTELFKVKTQLSRSRLRNSLRSTTQTVYQETSWLKKFDIAGIRFQRRSVSQHQNSHSDTAQCSR